MFFGPIMGYGTVQIIGVHGPLALSRPHGWEQARSQKCEIGGGVMKVDGQQVERLRRENRGTEGVAWVWGGVCPSQWGKVFIFLSASLYVSKRGAY